MYVDKYVPTIIVQKSGQPQTLPDRNKRSDIAYYGEVQHAYW